MVTFVPWLLSHRGHVSTVVNMEMVTFVRWLLSHCGHVGNVVEMDIVTFTIYDLIIISSRCYLLYGSLAMLNSCLEVWGDVVHLI